MSAGVPVRRTTISAVRAKGRLANTLCGPEGAGRSRKSPVTTSTFGRAVDRSRSARRASISTAMTWPARRARACVSRPRPGPISTTRSSRETDEWATRLAASAPLRRKCCESSGRRGARERCPGTGDGYSHTRLLSLASSPARSRRVKWPAVRQAAQEGRPIALLHSPLSPSLTVAGGQEYWPRYGERRAGNGSNSTACTRPRPV